MRLFTTLSLICFCLLFNCEDKKTSVTNAKMTPKHCMESVLKQDDSLGKVRNHACERISLSKTIDQYANAINNLNYNACPNEFEEAFKKHAEAWIKMGIFTEKYPDLRGEMHDIFDSIEKTRDSSEFKPLLKSIWDTWAKVEAAKVIEE